MFKNKANESLIKDLKTVSIVISIIYILIVVTIKIVSKDYNILMLWSTVTVIASLIIINYFLLKRLNYLDYIIDTTNKIIEDDIRIRINIKDNNSFSHLSKNINKLSSLCSDSLNENITNDIVNTHFINEVCIYYNIQKQDLEGIYRNEKNKLCLNLESNNINYLIEQIVAYYKMDFKINNLKLNLSKKNVSSLVYIDKKLLNKAIDLIIKNVLITSLQNTTVYIEIAEKDKFIYLSIKHIMREDIQNIEIRENKSLNIKYIENIFYIQDIKFKASIEASLFKYEILIRK